MKRLLAALFAVALAVPVVADGTVVCTATRLSPDVSCSTGSTSTVQVSVTVTTACECPAAGGSTPESTLLTDLVAFWPLDETSGARADSHASFNLTDNNTVTSVVGGPAGRVAEFVSGNSEYLTKASPVSIPAGDVDLTVGAWINPANTSQSNTHVASYGIPGTSFNWSLGQTNTDCIFIMWDGGGSAAIATINGLVANRWQHVLFTFDSATNVIKGYLNGVLAVTGSAGSNPTDTGGTLYYVTSNALWSGQSARLGIWSGKLPVTEITSIFNAGRGKKYAELTTAEKVGLVSYFNADEVSGNRADSHGSNTLTDNNTVTSVINGAPSGISAQFTAANSESLSYVDDPTFEFSGDFTVAAWVYQDSQAANNRIITKTAPGEDGYHLSYASSRFRFGNVNSGLEVNDGGAGVSTGQWYFVMGWRDAGVLKLRVNGLEYSGSTDAVNFANTGPFRIGARNPTATEFFDGRIVLAGVWSRVLTADERACLYGAGAPPAYPFTGVCLP